MQSETSSSGVQMKAANSTRCRSKMRRRRCPVPSANLAGDAEGEQNLLQHLRNYEQKDN